MSTDQPTPLTPDLYARIHDLPRPDPRSRLHAMFNLSEADETEFDARVDAVAAAETTALRARIDELEAAVGTARAMHRRHLDSEHCQYDDMPWPCPTMIALSDQPAAPEDEPLRCTCARSWNLHSRDCALYVPGRERINARLAADAEATHWKRLGINPPEPTL